MHPEISIGWWRRERDTRMMPSLAISTTVPDDRPSDRARRGATALLGVYVVLYMVPVAEFLASYFGIHAPIVLLAGIVLTALLPFVGSVGRFWMSPIARPWMTLLGLFFCAAFFGQYPRRSVPFVTELALRTHVLPFYCCAIAVSPRCVRQLLQWAAGGTVLLLVLCVMYGHAIEDRFIVSRTVLGNANDLAFSIVLGLPTLLMLAYGSRLGQWLCATTVPLGIWYVLKTGSRAAFVTLVAGLVATFVVTRGRTRRLTVAFTLMAVAVAALNTPATTWRRLTLIVADPWETHVADAQLQGAIDSQAARLELQRQAVQVAARHPVFGVGPLVFPDAADALVMQQTGRHTAWQAAHNTYLQIAAEAGLPAVLLYIGTLLWCFRTNYGVYRSCRSDISQRDHVPQALCLVLMTIVFMIGILFSNAAYLPVTCLLVGLTAANSLAVEREGRTE